MLRGAGDQALQSSNRAKQGVGKCRQLNDPGVSRNLHILAYFMMTCGPGLPQIMSP